MRYDESKENGTYVPETPVAIGGHCDGGAFYLSEQLGERSILSDTGGHVDKEHDP